MRRRDRDGEEAPSHGDLRGLRETVKLAKTEYHERRNVAEPTEFAALSAAVNDAVLALRAAQEA